MYKSKIRELTRARDAHMRDVGKYEKLLADSRSSTSREYFEKKLSQAREDVARINRQLGRHV